MVKVLGETPVYVLIVMFAYDVDTAEVMSSERRRNNSQTAMEGTVLVIKALLTLVTWCILGEQAAKRDSPSRRTSRVEIQLTSVEPNLCWPLSLSWLDSISIILQTYISVVKTTCSLNDHLASDRLRIQLRKINTRLLHKPNNRLHLAVV